MWHVTGKSLLIDSASSVEFEYPIKQAVEVAKVIVAVLAIPDGEVLTENAFGISIDGTRLWQVERFPGIAVIGSNCYMDVRANDDTTVVLGNWHGVDVVVDVRTGKIRSSYVTK